VVVWTDAHLSPALAGWLRATFGVEAVPLRELGLRDAEDAAIFAAARAAGAVLVTKDSDFVDLVTRYGPPPQIIWLTCGNTTNAALRVLLARAWPKLAELLGSGEPLVEVSGRSGPAPGGH
jgi:predicted nuclease of predicted toxin-antitoxin system